MIHEADRSPRRTPRSACFSQALRMPCQIEAAPLRVLFIGSSGTKSNNLPARVAELASASGRSSQYPWWLGQASVSKTTGASRRAPALAAAHGTSWSCRMAPPSRLGKRSTSAPGRLASRTWRGRRIPALRSSWSLQTVNVAPCCPKSLHSYRLAAQAALPSSSRREAWQAAWRCSPFIWFYGPDNVHPSRLGTYEWALVVYGALYDAPVRSRRLYPVRETPRMSRLLQAAAHGSGSLASCERPLRLTPAPLMQTSLVGELRAAALRIGANTRVMQGSTRTSWRHLSRGRPFGVSASTAER